MSPARSTDLDSQPNGAACWPTPVLTRECAPFWRGLGAGVLRLPRCACNPALLYPPPVRCPRCLSGELAWVALSGQVRLCSSTVLHLRAIPGRVPPTTLVEVAPIEQPALSLIALDDAGLSSGLAPGTLFELAFVPLANGVGRLGIARAIARV